MQITYHKAIRVYGRPFQICEIGNIPGDGGGECIGLKLSPIYETLWLNADDIRFIIAAAKPLLEKSE
jgi:hypothetical protein